MNIFSLNFFRYQTDVSAFFMQPFPDKLQNKRVTRLAPVLKIIFHQYVISYTCSQSNSDGS